MTPATPAWRRSLGHAATALFDCLFPVGCGACPVAGRAPFCSLCEEALVEAPPIELPGFAEVWAPFDYGGPAALALRALKYEGRPELGPPLGRLLRAFVGPLPAFDLVVPVPLSGPRLADRGYNQAREIARGLGFLVRPGTLVRTDDRRPQVGLSREERLRNLDGAFAASRRRVGGRTVLVVDDVVSTGATLEAVRKALVLAGADEVYAIAFARSVAYG